MLIFSCAIVEQITEDLLDGIDRPAGSHQVILGQDGLARCIEYHSFGAGGADINTQIAAGGISSM